MERESARANELVAWLGRRAEPAPASLVPRMAEAVRSVPASPGDSIVELASRAGERLLTLLLAHGCGPRSAAPDLLAADALVTYAFEAAAGDSSQGAREIEVSAARAMERIAALGSSR